MDREGNDELSAGLVWDSKKGSPSPSELLKRSARQDSLAGLACRLL